MSPGSEVLRYARSAVAERQSSFAPQALVVIPARNEAQRIVACLHAMVAQRHTHGMPLPRESFHVVVMLNGCNDASWPVLQALLPYIDLSLSVVECRLPAGRDHAGGARQAANEWAMQLAEAAGVTPVVLCTDGDSQVPADWITRQCRQLRHCDAIAGGVSIDPADADALPLHLRQRMDLEDRYGQLLDRLDHLLDPQPHDPWPRHRNAYGACLGFSWQAYQRLRLLTLPASGEDRYLLRSLERIDGRIRHDSSLRVITSGRLRGRAIGGMADTMRHRAGDLSTPCDRALEPVSSASVRALSRARLRRAFQCRTSDSRDWWPHDLGLSRPRQRFARFGQLWQWVESRSHNLARIALHPAELPLQIAVAEQALASGCSGGQVSRSQEAMA